MCNPFPACGTKTLKNPVAAFRDNKHGCKFPTKSDRKSVSTTQYILPKQGLNLRSIPPTVTAKECQALWTKLRICYTVHLRHLSRGRTSRFKLAKPLEFLGPFVDIQLKKPVKSAKVLVADEGDSGEDDPPPVAENGVTEEDCLIEYCPEEDGEEQEIACVQNIADQTIVVYVLFPEAAC